MNNKAHLEEKISIDDYKKYGQELTEVYRELDKEKQNLRPIREAARKATAEKEEELEKEEKAILKKAEQYAENKNNIKNYWEGIDKDSKRKARYDKYSDEEKNKRIKNTLIEEYYPPSKESTET